MPQFTITWTQDKRLRSFIYQKRKYRFDSVTSRDSRNTLMCLFVVLKGLTWKENNGEFQPSFVFEVPYTNWWSTSRGDLNINYCPIPCKQNQIKYLKFGIYLDVNHATWKRCQFTQRSVAHRANCEIILEDFQEAWSPGTPLITWINFDPRMDQ